MATKDQVIGGVAFFALLVGLYILIMTFLAPGGNTKESAKGTACMWQQKQLALALILYASENDDTLPFRDDWYDAALAMRDEDGGLRLDPYFAVCPGIDRKVKDPAAKVQPTLIGYSFNSLLDRAKISSIKDPEQTVIVFESINLGRNASDPLISFPAEPRHSRGSPVAFVDGHVKMIRRGQKPPQ
jgi:prepilin-type processing-associated H-X9-DG protein